MASGNQRSERESTRPQTDLTGSDLLVVAAGVVITGAVVYDVYRKNTGRRKRRARESRALAG